MRIGVDASALAARQNGIGRYLHELLGAMLGDGKPGNEWLLYGRGLVDAEWPHNVGVRNDHLPVDLGRVLALTTSLPAWLRRDRPDVFWGPAHRLPFALPRQTARVLTVHDMCWLRVPDTMRRVTRALDSRLMPRALHEADRIIAVSDATRDDVCAAFPEVADRVRVVREAAIGLPPPQPLESLQALGVRRPYALFVGTLEPRKNLIRLLRAFGRLAATDAPQAQIVIAGATGWGGLSLADEVARLALESRVVAPGWVDETQLSTLYRYAECFAMPSLYEGFGLPLLEAMAHGTPVLSSRVSAMPEVVGDAGLLVDPYDVEDITRGLRRFFRDEGLREQLAPLARAQAARFSWHRAAQETMAVFEEAIQARGSM
jgi:glycosyltransferase involved in cell wall biosynthesis